MSQRVDAGGKLVVPGRDIDVAGAAVAQICAVVIPTAPFKC
jgi:hypothetical protein